MGELHLKAQALFTGLAVVVGEQLKEPAHPIFDAAQAEQGKQGLTLAVARGHALKQAHSQIG